MMREKRNKISERNKLEKIIINQKILSNLLKINWSK